MSSLGKRIGKKIAKGMGYKTELVKKERSSQAGMIGSGGRSAPGKGAKKPQAIDKESKADAKGMGSLIKAQRSERSMERAKDYVRLKAKAKKDRTKREQKFIDDYDMTEANRALIANIKREQSKGTKGARAARKKALELPELKSKMAYGGMANMKKHMYVAGGSVKENPGLKALKASGPKGMEAYKKITGKNA